MSESNLKALSDTTEKTSATDELVLRINKDTNEVELFNPETGKSTKITARFIGGKGDREGEEDEATELRKHSLSVEEFRRVWERLDRLGLTWSTDIPPAPVFKKGWKPAPSFGKEYLELQEEFPTFPRELGNVVLHTLLHPMLEGDVSEKAEVIQSLLTQEYRAEFFFKYAIKVPYFEDVDWEVVVKAYERGTQVMPKIAYALIALTLRSPVDTSLSLEEGANEPREPQFITVAVNERLVDRIMERLIQIKGALEKAQKAADSLSEKAAHEEEQTNGAVTH